MVQPTSIAALRSLKRAELQAICKTNGLKANGKTDVLIQELATHLQLEELVAVISPPATSNATKQQVQIHQSTKSDVSKPVKSAPSTKIVPTSTHNLGRVPSVEHLGGAVDDKAEDSSEDEMAIRGGAHSVVKPHPLLKKTSKIQANSKMTSVLKQSQAGSRPSLSSDGKFGFLCLNPFSGADDFSVTATYELQQTVAKLLETVQLLQSELKATRTAHTLLSDNVAALPVNLPSTVFSKADALVMIESAITKCTEEVDHKIDERFVTMSTQMEEQYSSYTIEAQQAVQALQESSEEELQIFQSSVGQTIEQMRMDLISRIDTTGREVSYDSTPYPTKSDSHSSAIRSTPSYQKDQRLADAPPIISLASLSSPASVVETPLAGVSRSQISHTPTRSLSHGTQPSVAVTPSQTTPLISHSTGKHARDIGTGGNVGSETSDRKRARTNTHIIEQQLDDDEEEELEAESDVHAEEEEESFLSGTSEGETSFQPQDTFVSTKTGDENEPPISTSDPSFFSLPPASKPLSASASQPSFRKSPFQSPLKSRKSLPMANLPFPIVSPFSKPKTTSMPFSFSAPKSAALLSAPLREYSNESMMVRSPAPPATPLAADTLFGTEQSMFGDVFASGRNASPSKGAWKW